MRLLAVILILFMFIVLLIVMAISQIKMAGIKVKDFMSFIKANENLDDLYKFAKRYEIMSPQEQIIYLAEAERMFDAFDKVPETIWEDEHRKYSEVLETYKNIRVMRWNDTQEYAISKNVKKIKPEEIKIKKK